MFRNSAKTLVTYIKPDQICATRATCAIHWCQFFWHLRYSSFPSLESNEFPDDQHIFSRFNILKSNQIQLSHAQSSKPESMNWLQLSSKLQNFHESLSSYCHWNVWIICNALHRKKLVASSEMSLLDATSNQRCNLFQNEFFPLQGQIRNSWCDSETKSRQQ